MSAELPKGYVEKSATDMKADHEAWRDGQRLTTRCRRCRRQFTGTAAEGRRWAREHRESEHPELAAAGKRRLTKVQQRQFALERSEWRREKTKDDLVVSE
jgi:hypothetical protein